MIQKVKSAGSSRPFAFASICENGTTAKILLTASILATLAIIARALYAFRFRYKEMAFGLYYPWWKLFRTGLDPWHAKPPCLYPPPFVMIFSPLSALSEPAAYWIWQSIQVVSFLTALIFIISEPPRLSTLRKGLILGFVALLLPYFFTSTLYESEPTTILLLLLVAAWMFARRQHPLWAGLMLAAATVLKVYPVVAGGYFLFRRRFGAALSGTVWTIAIVLATDPRRWLNSASHGAGPYFKSLAWASDGRAISIPLNVYAALARLSGNPPTTSWLITISVAFGLILLAGAALITSRVSDVAEIDGVSFGLWMSVMLLLCPLTWNHEITLILPGYLFAAIYLVRRPTEISKSGLFLLAVALSGHAAAYYSTPMRNVHTDFAATLVGFAGMLLVLHGSQCTAAPILSAAQVDTVSTPSISG